jgi:DNA-3-methyladenine glycosylase II
MRRAHDVAGDPPLRRDPAGFSGLARLVVGQQVSIESARAIWLRLSTVTGPVEAATIAGLSDADLQGAGLSRPKIRTLRALTRAVDEGFDLDAIGRLDDEAVRQSLCAVSGIGPWTADVYLMFCLGRADVFAPGDLALQVAAQDLLGLAERPQPAELSDIAERWRPVRAVAARLLWAYYGATRKRANQPL